MCYSSFRCLQVAVEVVGMDDVSKERKIEEKEEHKDLPEERISWMNGEGDKNIKKIVREIARQQGEESFTKDRENFLGTGTVDGVEYCNESED